MNQDLSVSVATASDEAGAKKLGQPVPESNLASERKSSVPQPAQRPGDVLDRGAGRLLGRGRDAVAEAPPRVADLLLAQREAERDAEHQRADQERDHAAHASTVGRGTRRGKTRQPPRRARAA